MPGEREPAVPLSTALRAGGVRMLVVLSIINMADAVDHMAFAALAPEIQRSIGANDATMLALVAAPGLAVVVGAFPVVWLAGRIKRVGIIAATGGIAAVFVAATGAARSTAQMAVARVGAGLGQTNRLPSHASLLADAYPLTARSRVFAIDALGRPAGMLLGPLLAGVVATTAGGPEGWRWTFVAIAAGFGILALVSLSLREPPAEGNEELAVTGRRLSARQLPLRPALRQLRRTPTVWWFGGGIAALGFVVVSAPLLLSILLDDAYGYSAMHRTTLVAVTWIGVFAVAPLTGLFGDRVLRHRPVRAMLGIALTIAGYGVVASIALRFGSPAPLIVGLAAANGLAAAALVAIGPTVALVSPYRSRSTAFALVPIFLLIGGGLVAGVPTGALSDAFGPRTALVAVTPVVAAIGAAMVIVGSRTVEADLERNAREIATAAG